MASVAWNVSKDCDVLHPNYGNGKCPHLPVGYSAAAGGQFRALVGFSYSFTGITNITSAILHMRTSDAYHVAFVSPSLEVRRITSSWSEGSTGSDELWHTGNSTTFDNLPSWTSLNMATWSVTTNQNTWDTVDVTDMVKDALAAGVFYGFIIRAATETSAVDVVEFWSREKGSSYDAYIAVTYDTNNAPTAPTSLSPTGDAVKNDLTPTLQGKFQDPDAGDTGTGVQILLYADDGTTLKWDSGEKSIDEAIGGTWSVTYSGPALTGNTFYKWKARCKDNSGAWGPYCSLQRFKANSTPNSPTISITESPTTDLRTLTPTLNVTHKDPDASDTKMYAYRIVVQTSGGSTVWDSDETDCSPTATKSLTYSGPALSWATDYKWKAKTQDSNGAWSSYCSTKSFTTHKTGTPTNLDPTGGETAASTTPTLTGSRASSADSLASASVEVYASNGTTLVWSSGTFTSGVTSTGFTKVVGTTLSVGTTYKWRARVTASVGGTSDWSSLQTFVTPDATVPNGTTPLGSGITDTTPDINFTRSSNFNRHQLYVYGPDDNYTTPVFSDTPSSYSATGSKTVTCTTTLGYGKTYKWKVRVSSDGGSTWSAFTSLLSFTMDIAGVPTLSAPTDGSWQTSLTPTLQGSTYNGETISTFRIRLYASDQSTLIWDSGDLSGSGTSFSKVYNGSSLAKGYLYYWQASYVKTGGIPGGYSGYFMFHENADPDAPTSLSPKTGDVVTTLTPPYKATFSDSDLGLYGDYPTLYEVEVRKNSDSTLMHSLSKSSDLVVGENEVTRTSEGTALSYDTEYKFHARYTDSKSALGSWSAYTVFKPTQGPSVSITAPAGSTVDSPSFTFSWSMSSPGGKSQAAYRVRMLRTTDSVVLVDSGKVPGSVNSYVIPAGYLVNGMTVTLEVTAYDTDDLPTSPTTKDVSADWAPPEPIADFTANEDPDTSAILLSWTISNLNPSDFAYYQIYRRRPGDAAWTKYDRVYDIATVSYTDYYAANGLMYEYEITVFQTVPGDVDLESGESDIVAVVLDADVWYVVGADRAHLFELPVADEGHSEPIQQEIFEPLGSNRKTVVRGKVLGTEGTLTVNWLADEVATAKVNLAYITDNKGPHILKSPFGDLWLVEFSGPQGKYAGGGHLGVTLTYVEVA
jgi:hypothetical protein